ncbi:MAG: tRNA 2-thiouridine(34) synthase MnmA [Candidatus Nephrothrix sp. EaCA]|nr:MAG: tRNA 2-thiouridine(34) synthase MnmA [Candidatus Nephrothrix sp. EaCA]
MRVIVGLSGGVDSSAAALLLKEQGHEVIGLFMKNWHDESVTRSAECPWRDESNDALIVAQQIDIPFQTIDLSTEYKERIVEYMFAEYKAGRTPNPDVLCNREIKFDVFLKAALKLGADKVASGHYARVENDGSHFKLLAGKDSDKDQSYFLCQLSQAQLSHALFPVGELTKKEVRAMARRAGLATADKKDSQGLCFVGKVHLPVFLQQQLLPKKGNVYLVPAEASLFSKTSSQPHELAEPYRYSPAVGKKIGEHNGAHYYTIGQRRGLDIGGFEKPLFVLGTDTAENNIFVGMGERHPGLFRKALFIKKEDVHWVANSEMKVGEERKYRARIRYRQVLQGAALRQEKEGLYILFDEPQRGITPGQFAAWYDGEELIGSGVIWQ